jgi:hypothetical protein
MSALCTRNTGHECRSHFRERLCSELANVSEVCGGRSVYSALKALLSETYVCFSAGVPQHFVFRRTSNM